MQQRLQFMVYKDKPPIQASLAAFSVKRGARVTRPRPSDH